MPIARQSLPIFGASPLLHPRHTSAKKHRRGVTALLPSMKGRHMNMPHIFRRIGLLVLSVSIGLVVGCQGRAAIPSDAMLEQSGRGGLSYTASRAGNVFVLDTDTDEKVFEGHVNNGDQLVVNPGDDRVVLAGNIAPHSIGLKNSHNYEIFFTPE